MNENQNLAENVLTNEAFSPTLTAVPNTAATENEETLSQFVNLPIDSTTKPDNMVDVDTLIHDNLRKIAELIEDTQNLTGYKGKPIPFNLTPTEFKIILLYKKGLTSNGVADKLGLQDTSVRTMASAAYRKMNVSKKSEAVKLI